MGLFVRKDGHYGNQPRWGNICAAVVLIILLFMSFSIIKTGYTGVRITFGQVDNLVVQNGFNWKIPLVQRIEKVNNKQQDQNYASGNEYIWGETSEKVPVGMQEVTVTYQINPEKSAWICANVSDYRSTLVSDGIVASALKSASVKFTAEQVTSRGNIEPAAKECLQSALDSKYGEGTVFIIRVVINNMDFEESYNEAINARSLAVKTQETQKITNETNIAKAEADANVLLIGQQATSDALIIKTESEAKAKVIEATADAEANALLEASLSDRVLKNKFYEKWNGQLPQIMGSDGIFPMVELQ